MDQSLADRCMAYHGPDLIDYMEEEQQGKVDLPSFLSLGNLGKKKDIPRSDICFWWQYTTP